MSSTSERSSGETLQCSICLEVLYDPVTTPCRHNFCKRCICQTWNTDGPCTCPLCNWSYDTRPELNINTLLCEVLSESKLEKNKNEAPRDKPVFKEVQCDVCSEPKLKALKFCLDCLSSFCETHLQPHLTVSRLKRHHLMEPVENLEETWKTTQAQNQQDMVEQRRLKIQEIQHCMELSEAEVYREWAAGQQAFTAVMQPIQRSLDRFLEKLQEMQSRKQAQDQQLEQEIRELENSTAEAEWLLRSKKASLHFLQRCEALMLKEWSSVSFEPEMCEGSAAWALAELQKQLSKEFHQNISRKELMRVQQFAVDVTLDPDTAQCTLLLSEDLKKVHHTDEKKELPDSPLRFDYCGCVLGKQSFSSGRFYFEVQVKGKTKWNLGVAQNSIKRKGKLTLSPRKGLWCIVLRNNDEYIACANPSAPLSVRQAPQKVGVFVDYGEGRVSFYDADSGDLLYTFTDCCFKMKLFPIFNPCPNDEGSNSAPLVLTAVETFRGESQQEQNKSPVLYSDTFDSILD